MSDTSNTLEPVTHKADRLGDTGIVSFCDQEVEKPDAWSVRWSATTCEHCWAKFREKIGMEVTQ